MTIDAIKDSLISKFSSLRTVATVSGYDVAPWRAYPGASLMVSTGQGEFVSTHQNRRIRNFDMSIWLPHTRWGPKNIEDLTIDILDEVETALDSDFTLSGLVLLVQPTAWDTEFLMREEEMRVLKIEIEVQEITTIRT